MQSKQTQTQTAMMDLIKELRSDPERYKELKAQVVAAKTDEERVKVLTDFSIHEERLRRVLPDQGTQVAVTTVTVTTVLIVAPSAY